jgi:hypothetical protein
MPRVVPSKRTESSPFDAAPATVRVIREFTAGGHHFNKGDVLALSSPLIHELTREHAPNVLARYLQLTH